MMSDYSSRAGYDLQNHDVFISTVLSDMVCQMFYNKKDKFDCFDFGAGVFDISVTNVLNILPTPAKIRSFLGRTKITKEESKEIFNALMVAHNSRPYAV